MVISANGFFNIDFDLLGSVMNYLLLHFHRFSSHLHFFLPNSSTNIEFYSKLFINLIQMVAAIITYLVILIQFELSDKEIKNFSANATSVLANQMSTEGDKSCCTFLLHKNIFRYLVCFGLEFVYFGSYNTNIR